MTDTTAKIRAKGLDATGVTEAIAEKFFAHKGQHYMGIVEFKIDATHETAEGKRVVDCVLTQVEPALDQNLDEHLRELTRTLHYNRAVAGGQPTLDQGSERTAEDVMAAGARHRPHDYLAAADDVDQCDVCGEREAAGIHQAESLPDPFTVPDEDDEDLDDEEDEDDELEDVDQDEQEPAVTH